MENPVAAAIEQLGGLTEAVVRTGFSQTTWVRWRREGRMSDAIAVLRVEEMTGISARRLAGLELLPGGAPRPDGGVSLDAGAVPPDGVSARGSRSSAASPAATAAVLKLAA